MVEQPAGQMSSISRKSKRALNLFNHPKAVLLLQNIQTPLKTEHHTLDSQGNIDSLIHKTDASWFSFFLSVHFFLHYPPVCEMLRDFPENHILLFTIVNPVYPITVVSTKMNRCPSKKTNKTPRHAKHDSECVLFFFFILKHFYLYPSGCSSHHHAKFWRGSPHRHL